MLVAGRYRNVPHKSTFVEYTVGDASNFALGCVQDDDISIALCHSSFRLMAAVFALRSSTLL